MSSPAPPNTPLRPGSQTARSPDVLSALGALGTPLRFKRLAERLNEIAKDIYVAADLPVEPSWQAVLWLLDAEGRQSITQAAERLGMTHPSIISLARKIEAAGLIETGLDPDDGRKRYMDLTDDGRSLIPECRLVWTTFRQALEKVLECDCGDGMTTLAAIEMQLAETDIAGQVMRRLKSRDAPETKADLDVRIRTIEDHDREAVLAITRELVEAADTYAFDPMMSEEELWRYWCPRGEGQGYVARVGEEICGVFVLRANYPGPGSHIANGSYAVGTAFRGQGIGRHMGEASLSLAADLGFSALQFNIVVSTNTAAIALWRSLGFRIVGMVPDGFRMPDGRLAAHYIMHRRLEDPS